MDRRDFLSVERTRFDVGNFAFYSSVFGMAAVVSRAGNCYVLSRIYSQIRAFFCLCDAGFLELAGFEKFVGREFTKFLVSVFARFGSDNRRNG